MQVVSDTRFVKWDTDPLLQCFYIKGLRLKNRVVSTPHAPNYVEDGMPKRRYQLYHEEKAKGGIGMTMFGGSSIVSADSPAVFGQLNVSNDEIISYFQEFADRIHKHDCGLICQISHLGNRTTWNAGDWLPVLAPSRVKEPVHRAIPAEMGSHDIRRIVRDYAAAAKRCKEGGLDGTEILSHGHLLGQFLSPATNHRSDEYGGSLKNRVRFSIEVLQEVRERVGDDYIVGIRVGASEDWEKGYGLAEGIEAAQMIAETNLIDYMTVNFGHIGTHYAIAQHIPGMWAPLAPWLSAVAEVRKYIKVPLIHAARIADVSTARHAIAEGILDLVGLTRAHIADPHIVRKIEEKREHQIRPCVGASYCLDRVSQGLDALCLHNVATGREATMPHVIEPSQGPLKNVVVVGGGPAGLEAARVSASRGHKVILFEAASKLGGQVRIAAQAGWRRDMIGIIDWYADRLQELGVEIRWDTMASLTDVLGLHPDIVIIATGGLPDTGSVPGSEMAHSVWDALTGPSLTGDILVYDDNGQPPAPSCADYLAGRPGTKVEYVTPDRAAAYDMGSTNFAIFLRNFYRKGVAITPDYRLKRIERDGNRLKVTFENDYGGSDMERVVDHIVVEQGTLPMDELYQECRPYSKNDGMIDQEALVNGVPQNVQINQNAEFMLFRVGDAVASRNIHAAIFDSLRLCKEF
ncbi:NADH:flavin oxidoreductase [Mesorhizobium sp. B3-1-3]|uniref:NADH:flavin oxidoreductase n=1 Tax=unclassified Mesorhizobium TaxID=325217 RepID=UPI0011290E92|nr:MULTISPECIES: NADH:flavin oxidoreductase [unclassified Mesorhizobium]TPI56064.1 NADH:flavin oxidoreductase [Mesorhizobium sp. B3-1-8]TPI63358.1 NADH:flavin oxidoreductase [Mesorhizobium sp. B3-1-3]